METKLENQENEIIKYKEMIIETIDDINSINVLKIIYRYITATKG